MDRREILQTLGVTTLLPTAALSKMSGHTNVVAETLPRQEPTKPEHSIRFAVCGMSHDHIYGMVGAIQRGGGELVAAFGEEPDKLAAFTQRYPDVKMVKTQDEIINDPSIQLVLSSEKANQRAGIGIRAMEAGKDFLSDKPGITTLEQLAQVRQTIEKTKRIYAIMYSERLEVKAAVYAGELVQKGAIGKVIQTINIAPHQINQRPGDWGERDELGQRAQACAVRHHSPEAWALRLEGVYEEARRAATDV